MTINVNLIGPSRIALVGSRTISLREARRDLRLLWQFLAPKCLVRHDQAGIKVEPVIVRSDLVKIEAILLLGSNDLAPIRQAVQLYFDVVKSNPRVKIVAAGKGGLAGRGGHLTVPGQGLLAGETEAGKYAKELRKLGIPAASIIIEPESTNSGENIRFSQAKLLQAGIRATKVAIIQTSAAQLRADLVFERMWSNDWEYYLSFPPPLPPFKGMSNDDLKFHLAYALREAMTTLNYSFNPRYDFQAKRIPPVNTVRVILKYANLFAAEKPAALYLDNPDQLESLMQLFRGLFAAVESGWLKPIP